jgi:pyruvate ferredoxin oxidoreductase delta subunit
MTIKKNAVWSELPQGAVIPYPGSAKEFLTGDWRTERPERDEEKCSHCLICWIYCPDSAIIIEQGKIKKIDLDYCKGCGICAEVCPPKIKAIKMVRERRG